MSDPTVSWTDLVGAGLLTTLLNSAIAVLINYRTLQDTEKRVAFSTKKSEILSDIIDYSSKARRYWRSAGLDPTLETEIVELFDRIAFRLGAYFHDAADPSAKSTCDEMMESLHVTATNALFGSLNRQPNPAIVQQVREQATLLHETFTDLRLVAK